MSSFLSRINNVLPSVTCISVDLVLFSLLLPTYPSFRPAVLTDQLLTSMCLKGLYFCWWGGGGRGRGRLFLSSKTQKQLWNETARSESLAGKGEFGNVSLCPLQDSFNCLKSNWQKSFSAQIALPGFWDVLGSADHILFSYAGVAWLFWPPAQEGWVKAFFCCNSCALRDRVTRGQRKEHPSWPVVH